MIGEGVARLFENDRAAASAALDVAEKWITARSEEAARLWYLEGAALSVLFVMVPFLIALRLLGLDALLHQRFIILTATFLGAIGAWLSVLQRSGQTALDLAAGSRVQRTEGFVRVMTGSVGAIFVALLLRSGYVLPNVNANMSLFLAICIVAGLSERLVSSLAGSVEASAGPTFAKSKRPPGPPPAEQDKHNTLAEEKKATAKGNDSATRPTLAADAQDGGIPVLNSYRES